MLEEQTTITAEAIHLRDFLIGNFNIAVGVLQEDLGFELRLKQLDRMLETWLEDRWYCWRDAHEGNLPWLFARITMAQDLFGQRMRPNSPTCKAILSRAPEARLGKYRRLLNAPGQRLELEFTVLNHSVDHVKGGPRESIDLWIMRPGSGTGRTPNVVFEKRIDLRPETFLSRVAQKDPSEKYGRRLLDLAQAALDRYLARNPDARIAEPAEGAP